MNFEPTIPLLFQSRAKTYQDLMVQTYKDESGNYISSTYNKLYNEVIDFAAALSTLGVKRGETVGLISDNRREWLISDLAILSLGAIDVPRGCDSMEKELAFILSQTECRLVLIENQQQLVKILNIQGALPALKILIMFNQPRDEDFEAAGKKGIKLLAFSQILMTSVANHQQNVALVEDEIKKGAADDIATIIFTSGTTGEPKGVMLTHENYIFQLERIPKILYNVPGDIWLTVLPVWHSYERVLQYTMLEKGCNMVYSKPISSVMIPDITATRPHVIPGVPRLWEALVTGILRTIKKEGGIKKVLFMFFLKIGKKYCLVRDLVFGRVTRFRPRVRLLDTLIGLIPWLFLLPLYALGDVLVYKKVRHKLGGRLRYCISGGGALQPDIDAFYSAMGIKMLEGYGITETAPLLSLRNQWKLRAGCIGNPFPDTECRIVNTESLNKALENAEGSGWRIPEALPPGQVGVIMVRGRQVMKGYYKRPDLTKKVIDADGWFNTGDLGMLSYDQELKITGRAKDTIVLLGGENIEPGPIERAIKSLLYVESVVVLGQDKKYLAALIVPVKEAILGYAEEQRLPADDYNALLKNPQIIQLFRNGINTCVNHQNGFRPFEYIYRFTLLGNSFQGGRELSGKQEIMRHRICELYKQEIEALFV